MHRSKELLYESIKDLKSKQEFEKEIKSKSIDFGNLLDEDTIALLIVDELGRNYQVLKKIGEIESNSEYTVTGMVERIYESRQFKKKNGKIGKVINLDIKDDTGSCRLVLWNKDVDLIKIKKIKVGTKLKIINGYTKKGYSGIEINLGRWGLLDIESDLSVTSEEKILNEINGKLIFKEPTKVFFKDSGDVGFVTSIKIKNNGIEQKITLWDAKVKEIQKYKLGEILKIEDVEVRNFNGQEEFHVNENSKLIKV